MSDREDEGSSVDAPDDVKPESSGSAVGESVVETETESCTGNKINADLTDSEKQTDGNNVNNLAAKLENELTIEQAQGDVPTSTNEDKSNIDESSNSQSIDITGDHHGNLDGNNSNIDNCENLNNTGNKDESCITDAGALNSKNVQDSSDSDGLKRNQEGEVLPNENMQCKETKEIVMESSGENDSNSKENEEKPETDVEEEKVDTQMKENEPVNASSKTSVPGDKSGKEKEKKDNEKNQPPKKSEPVRKVSNDESQNKKVEKNDKFVTKKPVGSASSKETSSVNSKSGKQDTQRGKSEYNSSNNGRGDRKFDKTESRRKDEKVSKRADEKDSRRYSDKRDRERNYRDEKAKRLEDKEKKKDDRDKKGSTDLKQK